MEYTNINNNNPEVLLYKTGNLSGCLAHLKCKKGRRRILTDLDDVLPISDLFASDTSKLYSSKAWRRMGDKTQVFTSPNTALVRTRATHVAEVIACSIIASEALGLNTSLVIAAAVGHDIGHVPLGHQGEKWIANQMGNPDFCHEILGPIIAQKIERGGGGLNLTFETLDAMMRHSGNLAKEGMTQEAWVLRYCDKFAYVFHDVNDIFVRFEYPIPKEIADTLDYFGKNQRERTTTAIAAMVVESSKLGRVSFKHSEIAKKFDRLRTLMYEIYPSVSTQNVDDILSPVLESLDRLNIGDPFLLLSMMTDTDVLNFSSKRMRDIGDFNQTSVSEILPYIQDIGEINLCDPCLDW